MQTQEEKTLDLIKAIFNGEWVQYSYGSPWETSDLQKQGKIYELIESILAYPSKYRIAQTVKVVNYQTRLYLAQSGTVFSWSSLNNISQDGFEESSYFDKWLEPTQEYVCEYEETK